MKAEAQNTQMLEVKHLESGATRRLKNSLLSSNTQGGDANTLYGDEYDIEGDDADKDTVYSFFAEESEIMPKAKRL